MRTKYTSLIGKTVNNVTVLEIYPDFTCKIRCELCKKEKNVWLYSLTRKTQPRQSCGCGMWKKGLGNPCLIDITGKRFGKLVVLELDPKRNKCRDAQWICKCDCGKIKSISGKALRKQNGTKSCGCVYFLIGKERGNWKGCGDIGQRFWSRVKIAAKRRGIKVKISIKDAWNKFIEQNKTCALTGLPLTFDSHSHKTDGNASLDRIDSEKDYTIDNVQWVDKDVNLMKLDLNQNDFIEKCRLIAKFNTSK